MISDYKHGFQSMYLETKAVQEQLDLKWKHLTEVHIKLSAMATMARMNEVIPLAHFPLVWQLASELVMACAKFLVIVK